MAKIRAHVPIGLPIAAIVLLILGVVAGPVIRSSFSKETLAQNVLLNAMPFIMIFVSIVLTYITIIWLMASVLNNKISRKVYRPVEMATIAGIVLGVLGMFQPWAFAAYRTGFYVLLISTLSYIAWSHVTPRGARRDEQIASQSEQT